MRFSALFFFLPSRPVPHTTTMASDGAKQPLLSGQVDTMAQTDNACATNRRRFRRVRSAPLAEFIPKDIVNDGALKHSEPILKQLPQSLRKVAVFLAVYLGVGTLCFYLVEDDIKGKKTYAMLDALYFSVVTMTTVGYGDLVPDSSSAKILCCFFVFTGMALVAFVLSKAADYLLEKQEILLVKALHMQQKMGPTEALKDIETNKLRYKCLLVLGILFVFMVVGTIFLTLVEDLDPIDAFYCVCSTITTLGYGDESFSTGIGRMFAVFWIMISTTGLAQFIYYTTDLFTETRRRAFVKRVLARRVTLEDLEAADIDDNGVVGVAEFITYKLKEMGKISQEDISQVMEEFEKLDVDQSGTLSVSDLALAQATQTKR
uniref:Calcium-activated outward-rectifying potassium channel n=1 Tax=Rhizophora mucronata TaxID=61149 RepID=A0A2P2K3L1_RHIMU